MLTKLTIRNFKLFEEVEIELAEPLFSRFYERLSLLNLMRKSGYHTLAPFVQAEEIDPEVTEKLDQSARVAEEAALQGSEGR